MLFLLLFISSVLLLYFKSYATFYVQWGKIPFVPLFVFIVEIAMKVSNNETVLLLKKVNYEDNNERNHRSIF